MKKLHGSEGWDGKKSIKHERVFSVKYLDWDIIFEYISNL